MSGAEDLDALLRKYCSGSSEYNMLKDTYAELYAIIKTVEKLERHYVRGTIEAKDYEPACQRLIAQFKTNYDPIRTTVPDLAAFMDAYSMSCHRAALRIQRGLPATLEHADTGSSGGGSGSLQAARDVADATEALITLTDALALQQRAVHELVPAVHGALGALNRARYVTPGMTKREVLVAWATKLDGLRASDTVGEEDAQQMLMDVESVHREFRDLLQTRS